MMHVIARANKPFNQARAESAGRKWVRERARRWGGPMCGITKVVWVGGGTRPGWVQHVLRRKAH